MITKETIQHEFTAFAVFCGFELGLALACLATGSIVLCLPLIFGSLMGCWAVIAPAKPVLRISVVTHMVSAALLLTIASYGYYSEDFPSPAAAFPNFWLFIIGLIVATSLTYTSYKALHLLSQQEELQWRTPCGQDPNAGRSPINHLDVNIHDFECVLQIPDSLFASEQASDADKTLGIPIQMYNCEAKSATPVMSATRGGLRASVTSPAPAPSDYQSCKSNTVMGVSQHPRRYSHGEKPDSPDRGVKVIGTYFANHLSPRPVWAQMPSKLQDFEPNSDRVPIRTSTR